MIWETVIGLEVHAELSTKSKIFCGCPVSFGGGPNTQVCPVCSGMPGTLPRLNREVVEYAVRTGLALGCEITRRSKFDRKNYFYPDLPKAYQVSQLYAPICREGSLEITVGEETKKIGIREIHMEEDAGKLVHDHAGGATMMDYNRCGVPLLEIVTYPDFRCGSEVISYLEKLREILLYLEVCDCKMQEGSLRADVNLSVRLTDDDLGVRTEMKNLNSFKAITRAIEYESARQIGLLERGGTVTQETRRWDDDEGISYAMRSKENAQDYRYFPEPDLLPVFIDDGWFTSIKSGLPEPAHERRGRYIRDFGLSEHEAAVITSHKRVCEIFESAARESGQWQETARLFTGEIMRLIGAADTDPEVLHLDPKKLAVLVGLVTEGKINRAAYKETVAAVFTDDIDPMEYIAEKGLLMITDEGAAVSVAQTVIAENPEAAADFRAGKEKALGFLMGQAMKKLGGKGNPDSVRQALIAKLKLQEDL